MRSLTFAKLGNTLIHWGLVTHVAPHAAGDGYEIGLVGGGSMDVWAGDLLSPSHAAYETVERLVKNAPDLSKILDAQEAADQAEAQAEAAAEAAAAEAAAMKSFFAEFGADFLSSIADTMREWSAGPVTSDQADPAAENKAEDQADGGPVPVQEAIAEMLRTFGAPDGVIVRVSRRS